jgi:hypothetical protein
MFILFSNSSETPIRYNQNDGFVDIFIGLGIFFAGLFLWFEKVWMIAIFIPALMPSFQAIRERVIETRIGKSDPNANQYVINQKITLYILLIIGISVLSVFVIFFVFKFHSLPGIAIFQQYILLVLGMIFTSLWIFAGAMLRVRRYIFHAALTLVVMMLGQFINLPFWMTCVILGGLITFLGALVLLKLLKQYPHK